MSLAPLDRSASVGSRLTWVVLLCAVAMGIVGMHGLVTGAGSPQSGGHHAVQAIDLLPDAATAHAATPDAASPTAAPVAGEDSSPSQEAGLLALCLMVLAPAFAMGLWLQGRSRVRVRRPLRLLFRGVVGRDVAVPPPPFRRLTVLRI